MKKVILFTLFFGLITLGYNNCGGLISFKKDKNENLKSYDTVVGNPLTTHAAKTFLAQVCQTLTTCNPGLTEQICETGILRAKGLTSQFAVPAYALYSDLLRAENAGTLTANATASQVCVSDLSRLSCGDSVVQSAYDPSASDPFAGVGFMIPTAPGSCPSVFTQPPQRFEYYVATTGSDLNDGSAERPWATITHADKTLVPGPEGAIVHVAPGVYSPPAISDCVGGLSCMVKTTRSGTATAPITYISDQHRRAKIQGSGAYLVWFNSGDYVSIVGFEIAGDSAANFGINNSGGYVRIIGNHVHDIPVTLGCQTGNGGEGISNEVDSSAHDIEVIGNLVHDIGPKLANGLPEPSYCAGAAGIGYRNSGGKIQNNIIYRVSEWGIFTWRAASRLQITNNLIFDSGSLDRNGQPFGGALLIAAESGVSPLHDFSTVANNIIRNNSGNGIVERSNGNNNLYLNNVLFSNSKDLTMNGSVPRGTLTSDPLMVNFKLDGSGNYRLQAGSPLVDGGSVTCAGGTTGCTPRTDYSGFAGPYGNALDIGPLEWHP